VSGLIGPNGAGKTTLLDSATGFAVISSGEVLLHGRSISHLSPDRRARAGLRRTFQQVRISADLTVERYLRFAAGRRAPRDDLASAVALFGCPPGDRIVGTLDVPARRLVEIAAAVAARPAVLLLDEPAAGLGEAETAELAERLARVPGLFGTSVLLVEHDMELVRALCSTVTVLDYGKVLASGAPHEVLSTAQVQTAYLGVGTES
jgi:branched-chain amino acid transport system permease protein